MEKKKYTPEEKQKLLQLFGEALNDQSLRIIEAFTKGDKDLNIMLKTAWKYKYLC